jgi:hypothetical protein
MLSYRRHCNCIRLVQDGRHLIKERHRSIKVLYLGSSVGCERHSGGRIPRQHFLTGTKKPAEAGFSQDHPDILSESRPGHGRSSLILMHSLRISRWIQSYSSLVGHDRVKCRDGV